LKDNNRRKLALVRPIEKVLTTPASKLARNWLVLGNTE
jgi:hypothetical protein